MDTIEATIRQYAEDRLILIMLGPTAKVLAAHLANDGYQALDIGHIDTDGSTDESQVETQTHGRI